jgi:hypothetical protein
MTDFGRYSISYQPGPLDPYSGVIEHSVEMSISGQANIEQMLAFFDAFLKANGYVYDGEISIEAPVSNDTLSVNNFIPFDTYDFGDDGFSLVGNPIYSSYSNDTITFG